MARKKNPKSKLSFGGLRLKPEEDKTLMRLLDEKKISLAKLNRKLIRAWIEKEGV